MKLLSKTELKDANNRSATASREIDQSLAKKTKELNTFSVTYEAKKKQILDDYIQFAEKIAGEKALLEQGFATTEERSATAVRSLSALSMDADKKLRLVGEKSAELDEREKKVSLAESRAKFSLEKITDDEKKTADRSESLDRRARVLEESEKNLAAERKTDANRIASMEESIAKRDRILNVRESDLSAAATALLSSQESLKKEKEAFADHVAREKALIEGERKRDIKEIVETSYKKRESTVSESEKSIAVQATSLAIREKVIKGEEARIEAEKHAVEQDRAKLEAQKNERRDYYAGREAHLAGMESIIDEKAKDLRSREQTCDDRDLDMRKREENLASNTAKSSEKALERQRALDEVAANLKKRWEDGDKVIEKRTRSLDQRESAIDDREVMIAKKEDTARIILSESTEKANAFDTVRRQKEKELADREKTVTAREISANSKLEEARLMKIAAEDESAQLVERTKREEDRIKEEKRALVDARKTLDRAWIELSKKQNGR